MSTLQDHSPSATDGAKVAGSPSREESIRTRNEVKGRCLSVCTVQFALTLVLVSAVADFIPIRDSAAHANVNGTTFELSPVDLFALHLSRSAAYRGMPSLLLGFVFGAALVAITTRLHTVPLLYRVLLVPAISAAIGLIIAILLQRLFVALPAAGMVAGFTAVFMLRRLPRRR
jgi:hypothetical protein